MKSTLLAKYDVAAPRYTSYPTVPYWEEQSIDPAWWEESASNAFEKDRDISLYIHLPFCERLCTYCGCNKHITRNHDLEDPYLDAVLAEWKMYRSKWEKTPRLKELHLGGGTPTFFNPEKLAKTLEAILEDVEVPAEADFGFEAHPNSTTPEHLKALRKLGFNRISVGVQDFDKELMDLVNRHQTVEQIEACVFEARELGFTSVNFDLIFGLPRQTPDHIRRNAEEVARFMPDRIAFYSYAHVPWIKQSQRAYSEEDLPIGAEKRALYELGRDAFNWLGYKEIGMDHFALPTDALSKSLESGTMHRNFMGYTPYRTGLMLGLGVSAISDSWGGFAQNLKTVKEYQEAIANKKLPLFRGHRLNPEDLIIRKHILNIMTRFNTEWSLTEDPGFALDVVLERLRPLEADGLVEITPGRIQVTETGRSFLRNICMALDLRYWRKQPEGKLFSAAV